jgi:hypothetical protein
MQPWGGDHYAARTHRTSSDPGALAEAPKFTVTLLIPTDAIGLLIGKVRRVVNRVLSAFDATRKKLIPVCVVVLIVPLLR